MSRINGIQGGSVSFSGTNNGTGSIPQQRIPVFNPLQAKIRSLHQTALSETMESMSLVMGTRVRQFNGRRSGAKDTIRELREEVSELLPKVDDEIAIALVEEFGDMLESEQDMLEMLTYKEIPEDAKLPLLAALIRSGRLSSRKRKRLEDAVDKLLSDDELSISLFAWIDLSEVDSKKLQSLKRLYQRIANDDEETEKSLAEWFAEVKEWSDRYKRVKVLIKALALDLKIEFVDNKERIYSAIFQLKKLLIFLGLSESSDSLANELNLNNDVVMEEVITVLEQTWITKDWFIERAESMGLVEEQYGIWLMKLFSLMKIMPSPCFLDEDHNEQILTTISEAIDMSNL
ncbi:TyeA family type III secretion system gatekeeper subunit [Salmonella enterica subsp. enterica]|nr:TyeA family type III secretion system gatekeeper subunit [Salmonella enterica subsp. enterica serovar Bonn]EBZ5939316.1 TyeA family type III secretion system gatekeeper subunit [Salmonella enterica subsp. enterica serovar Muenchen]MLZ41059.1 TyeA family type III secretion system gatekeeper subunit [Salmonella enterica subsp. enterica serovar Bonn]